MHSVPLLLLLVSPLGPRALAACTPTPSLSPSEPYRAVPDPYGAVSGALEAKLPRQHKDRARMDLEREYGRPPSPQEQFYADLGRPLPQRKEKGKRRTGSAGGDARQEHRNSPPVVELDFGMLSLLPPLPPSDSSDSRLTCGAAYTLGYNKGSKYDNGYGYLKAFDQTYDFGSLEELAAGMGHDPAYIWGARGTRKETEASGDRDDGALGRGE